MSTKFRPGCGMMSLMRDKWSRYSVSVTFSTRDLSVWNCPPISLRTPTSSVPVTYPGVRVSKSPSRSWAAAQRMLTPPNTRGFS